MPWWSSILLTRKENKTTRQSKFAVRFFVSKRTVDCECSFILFSYTHTRIPRAHKYFYTFELYFSSVHSRSPTQQFKHQKTKEHTHTTMASTSSKYYWPLLGQEPMVSTIEDGPLPSTFSPLSIKKEFNSPLHLAPVVYVFIIFKIFMVVLWHPTWRVDMKWKPDFFECSNVASCCCCVHLLWLSWVDILYLFLFAVTRRRVLLFSLWTLSGLDWVKFWVKGRRKKLADVIHCDFDQVLVLDDGKVW